MGRVADTEYMPDFTGYLLDNGRYKLLESLGIGAYGKVYRAVDTTSPKSSPSYYAVKCLHRHPKGSHKDQLQLREFALHKLVSGHPNVVTFHRWFRDDFYVYVVLDLCPGGDLFTAIIDNKCFFRNTELIKAAFVDLIDGLSYCHDLGVFHRDIKPENVLCSTDGSEVKLADFGLSTKKATCKDFGCGSSYYMSPECIGREFTVGRYSTRHVDIWALGVILTNMITGRNPWRYATSDDQCFAAYLEDRDFLSQVLPISNGVNVILKSLFHLNPLCRMSLPDLRREILALDDMYVSETQFVEVFARFQKRKLSKRVPLNIRAHFTDAGCEMLPTKSSIDSDEDRVCMSPTDGQFSERIVPIEQVVRSSKPEHFAIGPSSTSSSLALPSSGSGSGPESKGPVTPATRAVVPDVEVPDLDGVLGEAVTAPVSIISKFRSSIPKTKKASISKNGGIFRMALQRLKVLSYSSAS